MIQAQAHGHGYALEVHTDQGAADVEPRVRSDFLEHDGLLKGAVGGGGKGAARLGLRHNAYLLRVRHGSALHADGAVEVLAALRREVDTLFVHRVVNAAEHSLGGFKAGIVADHASRYLAGGAADNENIARFELCGGDNFLRRLSGLVVYRSVHIIISCSYYSRLAAKLQ